MRTWYVLTMAAMLSITTGISAQVFTDVPRQYGVDDAQPTINAAWLDYDNDGDLDLYVTNAENSPNRLY